MISHIKTMSQQIQSSYYTKENILKLSNFRKQKNNNFVKGTLIAHRACINFKYRCCLCFKIIYIYFEAD